MYETQSKRGIRRPAAFLFSLLLCVALVVPAQASSRALIPLGKAVGIKLFSDGAMVVSVSGLDGTASPAEGCGLREGDLLLALNDTKVTSTEQVQQFLQENGVKPVTVTYSRSARVLETVTTPQLCQDGVYRLGAWIRDSMAGIGTLTYYDPATGRFGALGHGITDVDTRALMPLSSGSIMETSIKAVKRGEKGAAGELRGDFAGQTDVGNLTANTEGGVFGTVTDPTFLSGTALPVAESCQVHPGKATILTTVSGDTPQEYTIEIMKVYPQNQSTRNLLLHVTDPQLIAATGGIVQGQSGSPILQDGRLVGAVTHVFLNDPTQGYGILMENMLSMAQ